MTKETYLETYTLIHFAVVAYAAGGGGAAVAFAAASAAAATAGSFCRQENSFDGRFGHC